MDLLPILLVEDDAQDVTLIRYTLRNAGVPNPALALESAEGAMAYLSGEGEYCDRAVYPVPTAVFIDLNLPGKSGHDLLDWIRQRNAFRDLIRVVLTGSENPKDLKRALALGANAYFRKPLTVEQLTNPIMNMRALLAAQAALV